MSLRDRIQDRNIWLTYAAILLLGIAYGTAIGVISVFMDGRDYGKEDIGTLAAWFALGIVVASYPISWAVRRFTAKKALVGCLLTYSFAVATLPYAADHYATLAGMRFLDGAASAGIWISCETILLARSDDENKGLIMALYMICTAAGYVVGPVLAQVMAPYAPLHFAFFASGLIAIVAAALVWRRMDPYLPHHAHDDGATTVTENAGLKGAARLFWRTKNSCLAQFAYGYTSAAAVLFFPLFLLESKGYAEADVLILPAYFAIGAILVSSFAGRLGDIYGHLRVMRYLAAGGIAAMVSMPSVEAHWLVAFVVGAVGAAFASISPLALALQGLVVDPSEYARANGIYNIFYAVGMLLGPVLTSVIFARWGGSPMMYHMSIVWILWLAQAWVFRGDDPAWARHRSVAQAVAPG